MSRPPEGFKRLALGDVAHITTGDKNNQDKVENGRYPFFVRSATVERINSYTYDGEAILVPGEGGIGSIFHYVNGRFDTHQRVYRISDFAPEVVGRYVYYYMKCFFGAHAMRNTVKATVDSLRRPTFTRFPLELPQSVQEQRAVVEVLDDVGALVDTLECAIRKKQDVREALAQELLTGVTRLTGFGTEWQRTKLGDLGMFVKGRGVRRSDVRASGVPCIRYGEIYTLFGDYTDETVSFVTPATAETALPLETGDLLFAGSGETRDEIGMCVAYTGEQQAVAGGDIVVLRRHQQNPVFMAALMNSPEIVRQKSSAGQGDAVVHIYASALTEIEFPLPSREEQDAIAEVIQSADREIAVLQQRYKKTVQIRQGMMQELLTGRIRLPVGDGQEAAA